MKLHSGSLKIGTDRLPRLQIDSLELTVGHESPSGQYGPGPPGQVAAIPPTDSAYRAMTVNILARL